MKGIMVVKELNKTEEPRCIVSEKDYDAKVGESFILLLEPFYSSEGEPFFYWRKHPGGFEVEGEGYIITDDFDKAIRRHRRDVVKACKGKTLRWIEMID